MAVEKSLVRSVMEILNNHDPAGLLADGAIDEHFDEALSLALRIQIGPNGPVLLQAAAYVTFYDSLTYEDCSGTSRLVGSIDKYESIGQELFELSRSSPKR